MSRMHTLIILLLTLLPGIGRADSPPFQVEMLGAPSELVLGLKIPLTINSLCVASDPVVADVWQQALHLRVVDPDGKRMRWPCEPLHGEASSVSKLGPIPPGTELEREEWFCPTKPGRYRLTGVLSASKVEPTAKDQRVWSGLAQSTEVLVDVVPPQGVDLEAYKAYDGDPLATWTRAQHPDRYGELLRRFPTSTYTAYVVWYLSARGVDRGTADSYLITIQEPLYRFGNSVPCDGTAPCTKHGWMSLSGSQFLEWRDGWFETVLKHHPDLWFADEIRLRLALDRYVVGDKEDSIARLENLAQHGGHGIASKASELLAALKEKGMLESAI